MAQSLKTTVVSRPVTPKRRAERILENVESLAVAVVLALLIRHFAIQPFQIPTGSMKPTLVGQESFGDRILVDMFSYRLAQPKRWEVVVFRYPLNRGINFVKRLVGLPGEEIRIRNGDIYVNGRLERKPRSLQRKLWGRWLVYDFKPNYREAFDESGQGAWSVSDDTWRVAATGECYLKWRGKAQTGDATPGGAPRCDVGDRLLRFRCRLEKDAGEVVAELREGADTLRLHLGSKGSGGGVYVSRGDDVLAKRPDLSLEPGRWYSVSFGNPDETVELDVDGREVFYEPYTSLGGTASTQTLLLGASGTDVTFKQVEIDRDLYHFAESDEPWNVPADSFFMLGDNTMESKDSRLWFAVTIRTPDGGDTIVDEEEIVRNFDLGAVRRPVKLVDRYGEIYSFERRPEILSTRAHSPFVERSLLLGRALCVFFPVVRTEPFRLNWRLVH